MKQCDFSLQLSPIECKGKTSRILRPMATCIVDTTKHYLSLCNLCATFVKDNGLDLQNNIMTYCFICDCDTVNELRLGETICENCKTLKDYGDSNNDFCGDDSSRLD